MIFSRDDRGWKIKTRYLTFHPVSYGTGTLARLSVGARPEGRRFMVHYFPRQDYATLYHDHPWAFRTLVLWGGYVDQSIDADGRLHYDILRPGSVRTRSAYHRHKTRVTRPTVTMVVTGPAERQWCEGDVSDWKCEGSVEHFNSTLGHIPPYDSPVVLDGP